MYVMTMLRSPSSSANEAFWASFNSQFFPFQNNSERFPSYWNTNTRYLLLPKSAQRKNNYLNYFDEVEELGININIDRTTAESLIKIETIGNLYLQKDSAGNLFQIDSSGSFLALYDSDGARITENMWNDIGYTIKGIESVSGQTQIALTHDESGSIWIGDINSSGLHVSGTWLAGNSVDFYNAELNFNQDFNSDGAIGKQLSNIEIIGNLFLQKDSEGNLYQTTASGTTSAIYGKNGNHYTETTRAGWSVKGVEIISGQVKIAQIHNSGSIWLGDINSDGVITSGARSPAYSINFYDAELDFTQDFNADGTIGKPTVPTNNPILEPLFNEQWHLKNSSSGGANVAAAWSLTNDSGNYIYGTDIHINIIDDGIGFKHRDLSPNYIATSSYDYVGRDNNPTPPIAEDHGTACAGVAAGYGHNGVGITGAAPNANISGQRLLGAGTATNEASALTRTLDAVDIYSNSWGPIDDGTLQPAPPEVLSALEDGATNGRNGKGAIYTWAGGNGRYSNDNSNYDGYANSRYVISVAAITNLGTYAWYSEPGANVLVSSPSNGGSDEITTSTTNNGYRHDFGGTSSATPLVSGIVALMLEANSNLSWRDVQHILVNTSDVVDANNSGWLTNGAGNEFNHDYGFGRINAEAAVALAKSWNNVADEVSHTLSINPETSIPDAGGGSITSQINITQDIIIETVEIPIESDHNRAGNLTITLTSPEGTTAILSEGGRRDRSNLNFTFSAKTFWGESSQGSWSLTINDEANSGTGNLNSWGLNVFGTKGLDYDSTKNIEQLSTQEDDTFSSASRLTYASNEALKEVKGLSNYLSHIEDILEQTPEKSTGDWVIGTKGTKGRVLRETNLGAANKIATRRLQHEKGRLRVFAVASELESESFIVESLDSLGTNLTYAYPEILHDSTTRSLIPSLEQDISAVQVI